MANLRTTFRLLLVGIPALWLVQVVPAQSAPDSAWPNYGNDSGGTLDGRLIALDGETGKPCVDFGSKGEVNLTENAATATEWTGGANAWSTLSVDPAENRATMFSPSLCLKDKYGES